MKSMLLLMAVLMAGCTRAPRDATSGHIPPDVPSFVADLECGMGAEAVDRILADNGLSVGRMGNSFRWQSGTSLGTNYSLNLRFDPSLNTILVTDKNRKVLFARTSVRRSANGVSEPVWTPAKEAESQARAMEALREATQEQEAKVAELRAAILLPGAAETEKQQLGHEEKILAALRTRLEEEEAANKTGGR